MKTMTFCFAIICLLFFVNMTFGQNINSDSSKSEVERSPAYKLLEKQETKVNKELDVLVKSYTEGSTVFQSKQFESDLLKLEKTKLLLVKPDELNSLDENYGNLLLDKVMTEAGLRNLLVSYTPRHPIVMEKLSALSLLEEKINKYKNRQQQKSF